MTDYKRIKTSPEVWAAIRLAHPDLAVFGSYSAPNGSQFGDPSKGVMKTSYGFAGCDFPILEARTTWDYDHDHPYERNNEKHEYWLCVGVGGE